MLRLEDHEPEGSWGYKVSQSLNYTVLLSKAPQNKND